MAKATKTKEQKELELQVLGKGEVVDLKKVSQYKGEIDLGNTASILNFGIKAQKNVSDVSKKMLEGVKTKETGEVGGLLVGMVTQMRGLDFGKVQPGKEVGWFGKLLGKVTPLAEFLQSYEDVSSHINVVQNQLERHKLQLLKDVKSLDKLYETTLVYFHDLAAYIDAGNAKLKEINEVDIPAKQKLAEAGEMLEAQNLNDLTQFRDALERKVHDLELTRTVVMQSLPSIRMVQQNDNDLVEKINTQILLGIPAWERQLALAVAMWRSADATKDSRTMSDFQNETLKKNAQMLRQSNAEARTEIERGVFDIEAVKAANDDLIAAIGESISIAQAGKEKRLQAAVVLDECEDKLKAVLQSAV